VDKDKHVLAIPTLNLVTIAYSRADRIEHPEAFRFEQCPPVRWPLFVDVIASTLQWRSSGKQHNWSGGCECLL
jgi:hypothetical protein